MPLSHASLRLLDEFVAYRIYVYYYNVQYRFHSLCNCALALVIGYIRALSVDPPIRTRISNQNLQGADNVCLQNIGCTPNTYNYVTKQLLFAKGVVVTLPSQSVISHEYKEQMYMRVAAVTW